MLGAMEIAVGVLLALAGLVLVGLVAAFAAGRRTGPPARAATLDPVDDLPDFFASPPGSTPSRGPAHPPSSDAVVALSPPPRPATPGPSRTPAVPTGVLAALGGLVVLLLVAAVVVASLPVSGRRDAGGLGAPREARAPTGAEARLRFGTVVLEERAVGVTVSSPELILDADGEGPVASLELPTWNCLAAEAPEDPAEVGCAPGRTEYAELRSPELEVVRDGDDLRIAGAFATATRPAGSDPEFTGRTYDLVVTVHPGSPGSGELELGDRSTPVVEGELRVDD
jgi:hypothetical protein